MLKTLKETFAGIAEGVEGILEELILIHFAVGILLAFVLYSIVAFVISKTKRKNCCSCGVIQFNRLGNLFWGIIAWGYVAFAIFVHIGGSALLISAFTFGWLSSFIFSFYIVMFVFMYLNYNKDKCNRSCKCETKLPAPMQEPTYREPIAQPEQIIAKPMAEPVQAFEQAPQPAPAFEPAPAVQSAPLPSIEVQEAELVIRAKANAAQEEAIAPKPTRGRAPSTRRASATARTPVVARETARVAVRTPVAPKKTEAEIAQEKKNERIEELAAKIERQRLRAAKSADTVTVADIPYSAQTRGGFQTVGEAADKMDALQRRMDALRKTVNTREVVTTETVNRTDATRVSVTKSVTDLRQEQQKLQRHYDTLENLTKTPAKNKFDENEVKAALASLKSAIAELQAQIDRQS